MNKRNKTIAIGATVFAIAAGGTGLAVAGGGGDDAKENEAPITGIALGQAESAALDYVGQGTVSGTEVGDEESYYEVEVTLDDGSQTDVQLDRGFNVVSQKHDNETEANDAGD